jgi:hypothetical protein
MEVMQTEIRILRRFLEQFGVHASTDVPTTKAGMEKEISNLRLQLHPLQHHQMEQIAFERKQAMDYYRSEYDRRTSPDSFP